MSGQCWWKNRSTAACRQGGLYHSRCQGRPVFAQITPFSCLWPRARMEACRLAGRGLLCLTSHVGAALPCVVWRRLASPAGRTPTTTGGQTEVEGVVSCFSFSSYCLFFFSSFRPRLSVFSSGLVWLCLFVLRRPEFLFVLVLSFSTSCFSFLVCPFPCFRSGHIR